MERRKHRVFLDSNVILSGIFSEGGAPRLILDLLSLELPVLTGLTGRFNLIEIERNIGIKMPGALPAWREHLPKLRLEVVPTPSSWDVALLGDAAGKKDLPVIASAVNGKTDHFVTGDRDLLALIGRREDLPFRAVSPAEFLNVLLPDVLGRKR
jgi:predicted nucleic acid-binding protein